MNRSWRRLAGVFLAVLVALVLSSCSDDDESANTLRLAVTDLQGLEELQREFGAFKDTFEETSGMELEFYAVNDRVAAAAALEADGVDVVFTGPAEYVVLNAKTDAQPIVSIRRPDYHSCIYTTAASGIADVNDLRGAKIGMSDIGSTSGHLGPSQLLVDAGIDPLEDLEVFTIGDAVHEALMRGDVDAVGVGCHDFDEYTEGDKPSDFVVLSEGPPLPPDVLMVRDGLDADKVDAVRTTFEENFPALLAAMLEGKDNAKYQNAELVVTSDADYDIVRSMYQAIGVDDFTEFVGS